MDTLSQLMACCYVYQTDSGYMKVSQHIAFEKELDLTPYCTRFAWVCL